MVMLVDESSGFTREERVVLTTLRKKRKMREDEYHLLHSILDFSGMGIGFEYELRYWSDVDRRFRSVKGAIPYSSELHEVIEGLIKKGMLERNLQDPIELMYVSK
ncbi:MAG: hypothetical protein PHF67_01095 [Candidatus Nanoarchaeia archaeon]|nr:hypothetical protein [Candidatus Nanoarchaeia archaeon]